MSGQSPDQQFWDRADAVIELANEQCRNAEDGTVSASLLYAAARFAAFIVGTSASGAKEMEQNKAQAIEFFTGQYRKMLTENLDDYIENFDRYTSGADTR